MICIVQTPHFISTASYLQLVLVHQSFIRFSIRQFCSRGLFSWQRLTVIWMWISNHIHCSMWISLFILNSLRPRQNGRLFVDDTFKCIFLNENIRILIKISLQFIPKYPQLTNVNHWFRWWLGADQATSHYLNQWWLDYWPIDALLGLTELI